MFFVYIVFGSAFLFVINSIKGIKSEKRSKDRAIKNGFNSYTTRNGYTAHISDGSVYAYKTDIKTGEVFEYNPISGRITRNVTKERLLQYNSNGRMKMEAACKTMYTYDPRINKDSHPDGYAGKHWIDTTTGKRYVRRDITKSVHAGKRLYFYPFCQAWLNIDTGLYESIINETSLSSDDVRIANNYMQKQNNYILNGDEIAISNSKVFSSSIEYGKNIEVM